jgi:hypothetical protein
VEVWLRGLLSLCSRFDSRGDDDLQLILIWADLPFEVGLREGYTQTYSKPELPTEWDTDNTILWDHHYNNPLPVPNKPHVWQFRRFVIFGNAGRAALDDFLRWADDAGAFLAAKWPNDSLSCDRFVWMIYLFYKSLHPEIGSPLRTRATLNLPSDWEYWAELPFNVFRASVALIDLIKHNNSALVDKFEADPTSPDVKPPAALTTEAPAPAAPPPAGKGLADSGTKASLKPPIVLNGLDEKPTVWGNEKPRLTPGQYRVVEALIRAHPDRLSKDMLANRSKTDEPIKMIDRLRDKDADWRDALDKPGQAHGGYGIRMTRPRKTTTKARKPAPRNG